MWKQLSTVSALALALSATPALAQYGAEDTAPPLGVQTAPGAETQGSGGAQFGVSEPQTPNPAAELGDPTGLDVYSSDGERIGVVASARANPLAAPGSIEEYDTIWVDMGGFLGLGEKTVMLTADQWTRGEIEGQIQLNLTADQVAQLPESQPQ